MLAKIEKSEYFGIPALSFECAEYSGIITLKGGNVAVLKHRAKGINLLHTTDDAGTLQKSRIYGIPILFPPNRISGGEFVFENRTYKFPINSQHNMHIHGYLTGDLLWNVDNASALDGEVSITLSYNITKDSDIYNCFGHEVNIKLENSINENGLTQVISFENLEDYAMPFGFAYHTTFNIPFNSSPADSFYVSANIGKCYELSAQTVPTGKLLDLDHVGTDIATTGCCVQRNVLDNLYTVDAQKANVAVITDTATGDKIVYESDPIFKHWILYNGGSGTNFLSIEPQTWCTNAPNTDMPTANFMSVAPYGSISLTTKIYVK